jgi:hypothetical protein
MPPPANAPRTALILGEKAQVALQVTSLTLGNRLSGRILRPIDATTLTYTDQTITVQLQPGATTTMGGGTDIKPGAPIQASGSADINGTLQADGIVILTGYVQLR